MKKLFPHNRRFFDNAVFGIFLLFSMSAKGQKPEPHKILKETAKSMRDANTINTQAVIFSVAELKAILAMATTDEVQFQFVKKEAKISVIVAIIAENPEPEPGPTPGMGPSVNMVKKIKSPTTSGTFFDAGTICPPPSGCMIIN